MSNASTTTPRDRDSSTVAVLSINDHPDIRTLFDWLPHDLVPIHYTIGGGKGAPRREVIYRTWS